MTSLSETAPKLEAIPDAVMFPLGRIVAQKHQPRADFDQANINSIAASVKAGAGKRVGGSGLISPLLVRWEAGAIQEDGTPRPDARVEIVAGETRYLACKQIGLEFVPVIITDMNSDEAYEDAVTENILRGDLSPKDEGRAFLFLMNKHGWSPRRLAIEKYHDESREGYIRNRVEMQGLNAIVSRLVDKRPDTITAARRIQSVRDENTQRELVDFMLEGGTFAALDKKIKKIKGIVPTTKEERDNEKSLKEEFGKASTSSSDKNATSEVASENKDAASDADGRDDGGSDEAQVYGSAPAPGVKTLPRIDASESLQSIENQLISLADALTPVELSPALRAKTRQHIERVRIALDAIEAQVKKS